MRKSWLLLAVLASMSAPAGIALPAIAAAVSGSSVTQPAAGALDLDKIPVKPIAGRQSVRGLGIDDDSDDDDGHGPRKAHGSHSRTHADDDHGHSDSRDADD